MKDDWSLWRHIIELVKQIITPEGLMLAASLHTAMRVLTQGPEWAAWPAIVWNIIMIANRTGRWLIPPGLEKFLAARYSTGLGKQI